MFWSDDPLRDFDRWSEEQERREKACPICACCGDRITDEEGLATRIKGRTYRFHTDCLEPFYTEDYITDWRTA